MPNALVKKYANKHDVSISAAEERWEKAKSIAGEKFKHGSKKFWPYVTGIFKKMMGENQTISFSDFILLESDQGQNKNDAAERTMIHKIVELMHAAGLMKGGVKTEKNLELAYDFLESDWGGRLWDKYYELFTTMHPSFEGPFDKRRYSSFKQDAVAWFKKWKNGDEFPADVKKLPKLHEDEEHISDLPEEEKKDAIIAKVKEWPDEFIIGNVVCVKMPVLPPKPHVTTWAFVSYTFEQLMGERLPILARLSYRLNSDTGFLALRWVLANNTPQKSDDDKNSIFEFVEVSADVAVQFGKFKMWVEHHIKKNLSHLMEDKIPSIKKGVGVWPNEIMLRDGYYLELSSINDKKAIYDIKLLMDDEERYGRLFISKSYNGNLVWQVQKPAPKSVGYLKDGGPVATLQFNDNPNKSLQLNTNPEDAYNLEKLRQFAIDALKKLPRRD
jgi:hypothetical protein